MKAHFFLPATTAVLLLTGCSAEQPTESVPEPETAASTASAEATESSTAAASAGESEPAEQPVEAESQPATQEASQVGGYCGTADGVITVEAYSETSCEFAHAIYPVAIAAAYSSQSVDPSDPTAPKVAMARGLQVASPVIGETYPITCFMTQAGEALKCSEDGDDTVGASFEGRTQNYWVTSSSPLQG